MAVAPGCPKRWTVAFVSAGLFSPSRPGVCPCCWSRGLTRDHFTVLMAQARDLEVLESLFAFKD